MTIKLEGKEDVLVIRSQIEMAKHGQDNQSKNSDSDLD